MFCIVGHCVRTGNGLLCVSAHVALIPLPQFSSVSGGWEKLECTYIAFIVATLSTLGRRWFSSAMGREGDGGSVFVRENRIYKCRVYVCSYRIARREGSLERVVDIAIYGDWGVVYMSACASLSLHAV